MTRKLRSMTLRSIAALFACAALAAPVLGQEQPAAGGGTPAPRAEDSLQLEVNAFKPGEGGASCVITLLATNKLGTSLDRISYELAFFDKGGSIDRMLVLDLKALPQGKSKVVQFTLDSLDCNNISRILINSVSACEGAGVEPAACLDRLLTTTKPDIIFGI